MMTLNKVMLWGVTVLAVEVSYEKKQAIVSTEACCAVPNDKILAALKKAGYSGTFIETSQAVCRSAQAAAAGRYP